MDEDIIYSRNEQLSATYEWMIANFLLDKATHEYLFPPLDNNQSTFLENSPELRAYTGISELFNKADNHYNIVFKSNRLIPPWDVVLEAADLFNKWRGEKYGEYPEIPKLPKIGDVDI